MTPALAVPPRLTEPALSQELQQLEDDAPPLLAYRARVAALVAHVDAYPPEVQGRIANFAEHEGLHAHAKSVTIRFEE